MLAFDVAVEGVAAEDMLLVALHRVPPQSPAGSPPPAAQAGWIVGRLLRTGELSGQGEITLRDSERDDLAAGRLQVRLFTRQRPLGDAMLPVVIAK